MNIEKAIALLPQIMALTADERKLLRSSIESGILTGDLAKLDPVKAEVLGVLDFLGLIAGWTIPA